MAAINKQVSDYRRDATRAFLKPALKSRGEPVLSFTAGESPAYGGNFGAEFSFTKSVGVAHRNRVKITSMQMADRDDTVRRLNVGYASDNAKWTESHGGEGVDRRLNHLRDAEAGRVPDIGLGAGTLSQPERAGQHHAAGQALLLPRLARLTFADAASPTPTG